MNTFTAAGSHPASSSPPEAESLPVHLERLLRFTFIMLALLALAATPQSSFFSITGIDVRGGRQVSEGEIIARAGVRAGDPRSTVRPAAVAARVRTHPKIASAQVAVQPSGRVHIAITERRAVAAVSYHDSFLLVDASGIVIETGSEPGGLPILRIDGLTAPWIKIGDEVPAAQVRQTLRVLRLLPWSIKRDRLEIRMDTAEEFSIVIGGVLVLLGPLRGLEERAAMLPHVLSAISDQKITVEYVDLRFLDNVVLRPARASRGGDGR